MSFVDDMARGFHKELKKIASEKKSSVSKLLTNPWVYGPLAGIAGWEGAKKMHKDWKIGRQVRKASGGRI